MTLASSHTGILGYGGRLGEFQCVVGDFRQRDDQPMGILGFNRLEWIGTDPLIGSENEAFIRSSSTTTEEQQMATKLTATQFGLQRPFIEHYTQSPIGLPDGRWYRFSGLACVFFMKGRQSRCTVVAAYLKGFTRSGFRR